MKKILTLFIIQTAMIALVNAQEKVNPVIKNFGGIYDIPQATVKPTLEEYNIVIDVVTNQGDKETLSYSLNNVARLINLHAIGGADPERINVVLAIHGPMTYSILNNEAYKEKFQVDNPNIQLIKELKQAGVKLTVCGQSLKGRQVNPEQVLNEVDIATSMLTTVTTYQLKGYALLKF